MFRTRMLAPEGGTDIYDTVTGLLREVPPEIRDPIMWPRSRVGVNHSTGETVTTFMLNVHKGPSLTLRPGGLTVERSLPKALHGQNIDDLTADEVGAALAVLDAEVADALPGVALPSLGEWDAVRADYCESIRLGDEARVLRTLDRLAHVTLPRKGLPVRGQHHSVRWPNGRVQPKVYSKFLETRGDPRAMGVLRGEASVYRLATFRDLTGLANPRVSDVLTPAMHAAVWRPFAEYWGGAVLTKEEMGDLELVRELVRYFGTRRAAALIGYCVLFVLAGAETRQDMLASDVLEFRTKYRVLADVRAFRAAMAAKGYDMDEGTERLVRGAEAEAEADARLVRHLGKVAA